MATYPGGIFSPVSKVNGNIVDAPVDWNPALAETVAVQTELGTLPKGDFSSVKARLDAIDLSAKSTIAINQYFDVWQRSVSLAGITGLIYVADRWRFERGVAGSFTVARIATTQRPGNFMCRITGSGTGATTTWLMRQFIEASLQYIPLNFSAECSIKTSIAGKVRLILAGTAGPTFQSAFHTGDGTFQRLRINGVSLAALGGNLFLGVQGEAGATDYNSDIDVRYISMNVGDASVIPIPILFGEELVRCQRYYEKSYQQVDPPGTATITGREIGFLEGARTNGSPWHRDSRFIVTKRTTPTITIFSTSGSSGVVNVNAVDKASNVGLACDSSFGANNNTGGAFGAIGQFATWHWTADAEI